MSATFCSSLKVLGRIEMAGREGELLGAVVVRPSGGDAGVDQRREPAVARARQRDPLLGRACARRRAIHALARQHEPHRPAGQLRRRGGQDLVAPQALAAEAAADERRHHAHLIVLEPEHLGERAGACC